MSARGLALAAILVLAAALRLYSLERVPLWLDEQCQLFVAQSDSFHEFWRRSGDLGPIGRLSYVESWIVWHLGGHSLAWFRTPAVIWGVAAVAVTFVLGRRWFSGAAGLYAAALLSVCGIHIQFSREARGYALLVLLALAWAWLLDRFARKMSWKVGTALLVLSVAGLEVHPVFWLPMAALGASFSIAQFFNSEVPLRTRGIFVSAMVAILLLAGICDHLLRLGMPYILPSIAVNTDPMSKTLIETYKAIAGGYWGVSSYVIFLAMLAGLAFAFREKTKRAAALCVLAIGITAALPVVLGFHRGVAVYPRYSLFAAPFLFLAAGFGIEIGMRRAFKSERAHWILAVILPLALLWGTYLQKRSPYDLENFKKSDPNWPQLSR
ncbi:MAG TPA: glycosyltransferase family 39 protein [Planctomycetota bacterium]|nr:glycosyltransferase family 39 protein [Planctomycetota bacterium]